MFNWKRFCDLAKVNWMENRKFYAWFFAIGIAVHFCVLALSLSSGKNALTIYAGDMQEAVYWIGYYLSAIIFSGLYFSIFSKRETALTALMLPASTFEKFILSIIVVAVLYPLVYTLVFQVINIPANLLAIASYEPTKEELANSYAMRPPEIWWFPTAIIEAAKQHTLMPILLIVTGLQAWMLAGALFFNRQGMLKSLLTGFIVCLALIAVGSVTEANPDYFFKLWTDSGALSLGDVVWVSVVWSGVLILLWATVYLHLKTKELK